MYALIVDMYKLNTSKTSVPKPEPYHLSLNRQCHVKVCEIISLNDRLGSN
jgi:hypothetical protein